jgi:predicted nucleic acid-binding protein
VIEEAESAALKHAAESWIEQISSAIVLTEVERALRWQLDVGAVSATEGQAVIQTMRDALGRIALLDADAATLRLAGALDPQRLRSLDAIHVATALSVRDEIDRFVTYDRRLADAAIANGLTVLSPS